MNNNREWLTGSNLSMPSGSEVEAATFHVPTHVEVTIIDTPGRSTSMKSNLMNKLETWRSQLGPKIHDVQYMVDQKTAVMKSSLQRSMMTARDTIERSMTTAKSTMHRTMDETDTRVRTGWSDMQTDMKVNPMKWAGIAAGSGFAIGLLGRIVHWRNKHHEKHMRSMPQLVIIESAC
ncbi:MAG: hypothetical protein M3Q69_07580 [Acidobacteriota bacterium]|nr:hypothetical protein [Acidobacteriota bacterium]